RKDGISTTGAALHLGNVRYARDPTVRICDPCATRAGRDRASHAPTARRKKRGAASGFFGRLRRTTGKRSAIRRITVWRRGRATPGPGVRSGLGLEPDLRLEHPHVEVACRALAHVRRERADLAQCVVHLVVERA